MTTTLMKQRCVSLQIRPSASRGGLITFVPLGMVLPMERRDASKSCRWHRVPRYPDPRGLYLLASRYDRLPSAGCILTSDASVTLANTPHNPVRFPDTVGIVIEGARPEASRGGSVLGHFYALRLPSFLDRLRWYCRNPVHAEPTIIREEVFHVENLGYQLKPYVEAWMMDENLRKCKECGTIAPPK